MKYNMNQKYFDIHAKNDNVCQISPELYRTETHIYKRCLKTRFEPINIRISILQFDFIFVKPLFDLRIKLHLMAATAEDGKKGPFTSATRRAQKHTFHTGYQLIFMLQHASARIS
ncbi:hypothetical protein XENORESO_013582 [Xenotaenia resolanae]|uniref:Uncharacterized protein n=1 Tax=Xenotaenia resolanae TaxID=208358 RepID=A0ABV0WYE6_9TELE